MPHCTISSQGSHFPSYAMKLMCEKQSTKDYWAILVTDYFKEVTYGYFLGKIHWWTPFENKDRLYLSNFTYRYWRLLYMKKKLFIQWSKKLQYQDQKNILDRLLVMTRPLGQYLWCPSNGEQREDQSKCSLVISKSDKTEHRLKMNKACMGTYSLSRQ